MTYQTSTPTRICLFGEHQDYLGLDVIALAVNLRFRAKSQKNGTEQINLKIRDSSVSGLLQENTEQKYSETQIDLANLNYENNRDYFKSAVTVLKKAGYAIHGCDLQMDSTIPIGKGMCSSTTMVIAYLTAVAAANGIFLSKTDAAKLAWQAEVGEFQEPGGMMDHYASALGGFTHMSFANGVAVTPIKATANGVFILIDSLQQKDTIKILASSKYPTLEALALLKPYGISSVKDFYNDKTAIKFLDKLDLLHRQKLAANIRNYEIQKEAYSMLQNGVDDVLLGKLLSEHHAQLRDGLMVSTKTIDLLLDTAIQNGGYGGKVNGSGGGGCLFVYAPLEKAEAIIHAITALGFPAAVLHADSGLSIEEVQA